jgi:hypothetical protein
MVVGHGCAWHHVWRVQSLTSCKHAPRLALQFGGVDLDPEATTLWFAGKQLQPDKRLADYLGRNDSTRAIVKLQKKGLGAPAREPVSC